MGTHRRVVVHVPLESAVRGDRIVARLGGLGLFAYGDSEEEAIQAVKGHFREFVATYRESGQLETRLTQYQVKWWWEDEYPADQPSYEIVGEASPRTGHSGRRRLFATHLLAA